MKPVIILPPNTMSEEHIKQLRDNDLCVVVAEDPSKVQFVDPIPSVSNRTEMEAAAIRMSRLLLSKRWGDYTSSSTIGQDDMCRMYVDLLVKGTPLDWRKTTEERRQEIFDTAKDEETRKIAREEARTEREAKKAAQKK